MSLIKTKNMDSSILSIVIIVHQQRERGTRCLQSVLRQSNIAQLEVLLIDLADNPTILMGSDHPNVRIIRMPGAIKTRTFGEVRAEAVQLANAPIVAFIEEHSAALSDWAMATLKAFDEESCAGISGPPVNDFTQTKIIDAIRLMNDSTPLTPHTRRETNQLIPNNSSYQRDVLLKYGNRLAALLQSEGLLYDQLAQDGYRLLLDSDIKFIHLRESFLQGHGQGVYCINRSTARLASKIHQWSLSKLFVAVIFAPILPWIRTLKLVLYWQRKDPAKLQLLFQNFLIVTAMNYYAVIGQALGLLFGAGQAGNGYLIYAVDVPRPEPDMEKILQSVSNSS